MDEKKIVLINNGVQSQIIIHSMSDLTAVLYLVNQLMLSRDVLLWLPVCKHTTETAACADAARNIIGLTSKSLLVGEREEHELIAKVALFISPLGPCKIQYLRDQCRNSALLSYVIAIAIERDGMCLLVF